jgi:hypothetical protein
MTPGRIGFCCMIVPEDGDEAAARALNMRTTTMAWLGRQSPAAAYDRLVAAHLAWCDVEVEAKAKNLASRQLADQVRERQPLRVD